jgi:thymidylate synthase
MSFTQVYQQIIKQVFQEPDHVSSPRGLQIKEKLGYQFQISNPRDRLPYIKERNYSVSYFVAESLWYLAGLNSTEWISPYSAFWKKISDDGTTANSAYGARIFKPHVYVSPTGVDISQWNYVINELSNDPDSRRAVIHIRSPYDSFNAKLDVPCTLSLQFFLRDDNLHMITSMRSSDAILGIGNDIPAFTIFQELMTLDLSEKLGRKIELGTYHHVSNSMHIYERDYGLAQKVIDAQLPTSIEMPRMPSRPPLDTLLNFESQVRNSTNPEMMNYLNELEGQIEPYWLDWAKILASHWAGKRGDSTLQSTLLSNTAFEGYRFFSR